MFELISLEDSFLRRAFLLDGADFKLLSFCHAAGRGRYGQKFSLAFADAGEALDLTAIELRESLGRLARAEWLAIEDFDEDHFTYQVRGPAEPPVMSLPHLEFEGGAPATAPAEETFVGRPAPSAELSSAPSAPREPAPNPLAQGLLLRMIEKIPDARVREQESAALAALLRHVPADTIVGALRELGPAVPQRFTALLAQFTQPGALTL